MGIPGGCSSPAKRPVKASAPGFGAAAAATPVVGAREGGEAEIRTRHAGSCGREKESKCGGQPAQSGVVRPAESAPAAGLLGRSFSHKVLLLRFFFLSLFFFNFVYLDFISIFSTGRT